MLPDAPSEFVASSTALLCVVAELAKDFESRFFFR